MDNPQKIVIASSNPGKIRELTMLLLPLNFGIITQAAFGIEDAEESGQTFIENAIIKARHASRISGLAALADDSGLVVNALNGEPGIHSARYAGVHCTTEENIEKLLHAMRDVPDEHRQAVFHCVLVLLAAPDDPAPLVCHGKWHGIILRHPRGERGFGYDPIFYVPTEDKSAAELSSEIKNKISHRALALQSLVTLLAEQS